MGPEGKWRVDHCHLERADTARAVGWIGSRTRADEPGGLWQHRHEFLLVRREHARHWLAFLRIHGLGFQMADPFCREPGAAYSCRPHPTAILAEFSGEAGFVGTARKWCRRSTGGRAPELSRRSDAVGCGTPIL